MIDDMLLFNVLKQDRTSLASFDWTFELMVLWYHEIVLLNDFDKNIQELFVLFD